MFPPSYAPHQSLISPEAILSTLLETGITKLVPTLAFVLALPLLGDFSPDIEKLPPFPPDICSGVNLPSVAFPVYPVEITNSYTPRLPSLLQSIYSIRSIVTFHYFVYVSVCKLLERIWEIFVHCCTPVPRVVTGPVDTQ